MALPDLTGQNIQDTYKRVIHTDGTNLYDGTGSLFTVVSASYAVTSSHEVTLEVSSSHAQTADQVGSFTATAIGQCYDTIANNGQGQITFTELDNGTDVLSLTNLTTQGTPSFGTLTLSTAPASINADDFGLRASIFFPEGASEDNGVHLKVKTSTMSPGVFLGGRNENIMSFLDQENNLVATISQGGVFSGTATKATTFDPTSDQTLNNNIDILGKETGGTARHMLSMSSTNIVRVGATSTPLSLRSSGNIHVTGSIISANDISAANLTITDDIIHAGDTNNLISFGTDTQDFQTGGSSRLDISDSGVRLGGANARVTTILDEDNMASDSATSLATQQSIKAYVDANAGGSVSGNTFATDLKIGRDADNLIDFTTDNQVTFRVSANNGIVMKASGEIEATKFDGALEGNADTATALATARNIGGVSFDGTGDINLPGVNSGGNQDTSGNAATATALETARNIGGVSFNGTGNIDLPGVNSTGNQNTSGTAAVATAVTVTDNESTDEENVITFVAGAAGSGNVGLEADGDLTYNPSTGTLTTTKLTATGDVSSSLTSTGSFGKVEAAGEIRGKMLDIKISNFKAALDGTEQLLPLSEGELEATSHTNARVPMVAPYDGRLVKVMMKGSGDTSTHDYVMTFYKYDNGDNTKDTVQQITIAAASMGGSYTANTFEFTAAPISKGDNILLGLNSNKASNLNYYNTIVFEWDYNS